MGLVGGFCCYKKMNTAKEGGGEEVQEKDVEVEDEV